MTHKLHIFNFEGKDIEAKKARLSEKFADYGIAINQEPPTLEIAEETECIVVTLNSEKSNSEILEQVTQEWNK